MEPTADASTKAGFLDERAGWTKLKQLLFLEPLPGGSRWAAAFGSLLLFSFILQVVTGILLALSYSPSAETAWPSVKYIQEEAAVWEVGETQISLGAFIRALHHWGSSAMVILLLLHLIQVFVWGAYKKPRELTWMAGVLLLFVTLGLSFTGYLLPWDQKAYWATKVGLGIGSTTPVIGDWLRELLQGGPQMGNLTLTRFFTLHGFVLPGILILLLVVHLYLFRVHGVTPPWWESSTQLKAEEEPFWPKQVLKDGILALALLLILGWWSHTNPAPLETQADASQPYEARPEWYFMFLFMMLRWFHGPFEIVGTFVLPTLFFLVLFFWPFIDRNPHRDPRRRPFAIALFAVSVACLIGLTITAIATDVRMQEPEIAKTTPTPAETGSIQWADVAKLYNSHCAACHDVDGTAKQIRAGMPTIPDFTSMAWQLSQTEVEIAHRIQDGNEPLMPAYRDKLTQKQILAMTVYVRGFKAGEGAAPKKLAKPDAKVQAQMPPAQIYTNYCIGCHDADGSGNSMRKSKVMPDIPDFRDPRLWKEPGIEEKFKISIWKGTGNGKFMVSMEDKLGPADTENMVRYLKKLFAEEKEKVPSPPLVIPKSDVEIVPKDVQKPLPETLSPEMAARLRVAAGTYRQLCLVCHGVDGKGTDMKASIPKLADADFSSRAWQESRTNAEIAIGIQRGKGTLMPAFGDRINEKQAQDLVAYIRAFGPAPAMPPPDSDFEKRFRELQEQWREFRRQLNETPPTPKKKAMLPPAQPRDLAMSFDLYFGCPSPGTAFTGGCSRSSLIGCENISRLGEGSTGGLGGGTSCQRRIHSMSTAYSWPVMLARTRIWAATFL
jgi:quinol-cytochrome oxidoreductase complex cytochrome b subunit/cytochrome c